MTCSSAACCAMIMQLHAVAWKLSAAMIETLHASTRRERERFTHYGSILDTHDDS
jgi:hypothetical protein